MPRVYMSFMAREGWFCHFLEEDLKTPLPKRLAFADPDQILVLARRGGAKMDLEAQQAIRHGLEIGRGGVWLNLTDEQYQRLKAISARSGDAGDRAQGHSGSAVTVLRSHRG